MATLLQRVTVLVNNSKHVLEVKECRRFAPPGIYSYTVKLPPSGHKNVPATMFHRRAINAWRSTALKIFVDGVYSNVALTPQDFIDYVRISFRVDENGNVAVSGIKATCFADHLCRIRLVSCLMKCLRFITGSPDYDADRRFGEDIT